MEKLGTVVGFLETIFPSSLAFPSDPPSLQIKGRDQVEKILVALELNSRVFRQAVEGNYDFLYLHHPPIWEPITSLFSDDPWLSMLGELYHREISVLAHHTNLDSAAGGLAEQWIKILGLEGKTWPLAPRSLPQFKVVTFVPSSHRDELLEAIFRAGGGKIGNYRECSFLLSGKGTFRPQEGAHPFLGRVGEREEAEEVRVEVNVEENFLSQVIESIFSSHPYEQPVVDVYPLFPFGDTGLGRIITTFSPLPREELEKRISVSFPVEVYYPDGDLPANYQKIALCPGSGKSLVNTVIREKAQAFVSGDLSHHDIAKLNLWGITYYHIPHAQGERRALQEVYQDLRGKVDKQGLKVKLDFEAEGKVNG